MLGAFYQIIYLFVVTIFSLVYYNNIFKQVGRVKFGERLIPSSLVLAIAMTVFIGLRPDWFGFIDSRNFIRVYNLYELSEYQFDIHATNLIFDNVFFFFASKALGWQNFFLLISTIYFMCMWLACRKIFGNYVNVAYVVFLAAFSTFSYATNGIKAGAAASIFMLAVAYRDNWKAYVPLLLISLGFHHSMVLPIAAFVLSLLNRNTKLYIAVWLCCVFLALAHITFFQRIFASLADEGGAAYLESADSDWGGKTGFRWDFVLYSAMPVLVGYWTLFIRNIQVNRLYTFMLRVYLTVNSVWMLCMYAEYTNRIAYLSWCMYPIVLIFPLFGDRSNIKWIKTLSTVMFAHLAFTLFMEIVYY